MLSACHSKALPILPIRCSERSSAMVSTDNPGRNNSVSSLHSFNKSLRLAEEAESRRTLSMAFGGGSSAGNAGSDVAARTWASNSPQKQAKNIVLAFITANFIPTTDAGSRKRGRSWKASRVLRKMYLGIRAFLHSLAKLAPHLITYSQLINWCKPNFCLRISLDAWML